jgi:predicted GNAT superfamily acetyltransferase
VAEWWLRSARVEAVVRGEPVEYAAGPERISVPANIGELKRSDAQAAEKVQTEVREQFEKWFGQGYAVTGFELDAKAGTYLLEPYVRRIGED